MQQTSRFVVRYGNHEFPLPGDLPWKQSPQMARKIHLRVGWRLACEPYSSSSVEKFLEANRIGSRRFIRGRYVMTAAQNVAAGVYGQCLIIDLWTEGVRADASELRQVLEALDAASKEVSAGLELGFSRTLDKKQEFLELRVPRMLKGELNPDRVRQIIKAHLKEYFHGDLPTVAINAKCLSFGPEPPGPIEAFERYLREEGIDKPAETKLETSDSWSGIPVLMAGVLVLSWFFPLKIWAVAFISIAIAVLMTWALWPMRRVGFRAILKQSVTIAAIGFFGIALFGVAYSVCALASDEEFGHITRLGYLFLFSTSLGVAGGVLGEPKGVARVLVHIQLLLFLSALVTALARLLRIDQSVRRRG